MAFKGDHAVQDDSKRVSSLREGDHRRTKKPPLTHFLCLPLSTDISRPQLERSLYVLREEIEKDSRIPLNSVRPPGTLHFTLGVMSLETELRIADAVAFLQGLQLRELTAFEDTREQHTSKPSVRAVVQNQTTVSLTSMYSMHSARKTSVLYTTIGGENKNLHTLALKAIDLFRAADFLVPEARPLKLHATVLNTIFAKAGRQETWTQVTSSSGEPPASTARNGLEAKSRLVTTTADPGVAKTANELASGDQTVLRQGKREGRSSTKAVRIDSTSLLETFKGFVWASDFRIEKLAICKMGAKNILSKDGEIVDQEYEEIASIPLPV